MSSLVNTTWNCRNFARFCEAYLDGELEGASVLGAEAHVSECETCRDQANLGRAMRGSVRKVARESREEREHVGTSESFRQRVVAAMVAEQARSEARGAVRSPLALLRAMPRSMRDASHAMMRREPSWRSFGVALASAAAIALMLSSGPNGWVGKGLLGARRAMHIRTAGVGSDLVADLIAQHARPLPPERTDPREVRALEQYVGVPVLPARFERGGARFVGGRVMAVHQERAAMLQYEIGSGADARRVSVFVYDPRRIQIDVEDLAPRRGEPEGPTTMRVGHAQGYALAVTELEGVGYALATDMDPDNSTQFAAFVK